MKYRLAILGVLSTAWLLSSAPKAEAQVASAQALAWGLDTLANSTPVPDPFPIQRVLWPTGKPLPIAPPGDPFVEMSRAEFEKIARAASENGSPSARLVRATYRARFLNSGLTGTGEWIVSGARDSLLPIDTLRLAARDLRWADRVALTFGSPPKLWVDRSGTSALAFQWSARGTEVPGVVGFDLGLPAAPMTQLELDLPGDHVPIVKASQLLIGPIPQANNRAMWRIAFSGETRLEFGIRSPAAVGTPAPFATLARTARIEVQPGLALATVQFDGSSQRGSIATWAFAIDPGQTVTDVSSNGIETWQLQADADPAKPARLTIQFREPISTAKIAISTVGNLPRSGEAWSIPSIRPVAHVLLEDLCDVRISPDVKLEGWNPGDYRLLRSNTSDGVLTLNFKGTLPSEGRKSRRGIALTVRPTGAVFTSTDSLEWRIEPQRSRLTGRFRIRVLRGPLARIVCRIPLGFTPIAAALTPDDPTAIWSPLSAGTWVLEPTQPFETDDAIELRVELRGPTPKFATPEARWETPVPPLSLIGAEKREGTATISLAPTLHGSLAPTLHGWLSHRPSESSETTRDTFVLRFQQNFDAMMTVKLEPNRPDGPVPAEVTPSRTEPSGVWKYTDLHIVTSLDYRGQPHVELVGTVLVAGARVLPIVLPEGAILESATVDDKWADPQAENNLVRLALPIPDADGVKLKLRYCLPNIGRWWARLPNGAVDLPGSPDLVHRWEVGPEYRFGPMLAEIANGPTASTWIVSTRLAMGAGYTLALLLFVFAASRWASGTTSRSLRYGYGFVAVGLVLAVQLASEGWAMVLLLPSLAAILSWLLVSGPGIPQQSRRVAVLFLMAALTPGVAQPPERPTVYLYPTDPAQPERLTAWVPQSVRNRLRDLARSPLPPVVLTDAAYSGRDSQTPEQFEAVFQLQVTREGTHMYALPLSNIRLEACTLDGKTAYPDSAPDGRYSFPIFGLGSHELRVQFAVASVLSNNNREIRFGIPEHFSSRLQYVLPASGRFPTAIERLGTQKIETGTSSTLEAELGAHKTLAIRWREGASTNAILEATAAEATVWNIDESHAEGMYTCVHTIRRGSISRFTFDIPADLEPSLAAVRSLDSTMRETAMMLRNWALTSGANGQRQLRLDLQSPAVGTVQVSLRLYPTAALTTKPALRMPRATAVEVVASYLGVRMASTTAEAWQNENLVDFPIETVVREFASVPELGLDKSLARFMRREGSGVGLARPSLRTLAPPAPNSHELIWTVGQRAEVRGSARWPNGSAVEMEVPAAVVIHEVIADELAGWQRSGNRIRAWFSGEIKDPSLQWVGSWPGYKAGGAPLELPNVALPHTTLVRVRPTDDTVSIAHTPANTKLVPTVRPRETAFTVGPNASPPLFQFYPPGRVAVRQWEDVTNTSSAIELHIRSELQVEPNRPHAFTLQLSGLPVGAETKLPWPATVTAVEIPIALPYRRWHVVVPASPLESLTVGIDVRIPRSVENRLPTVEFLSGVVPIARSELHLTLPEELRPEPRNAFVRERDRTWKVMSDEPIRLVDSNKPASVPTMVVPQTPVADVDSPPPSSARTGSAIALAAAALVFLLHRRWSRRHKTIMASP